MRFKNSPPLIPCSVLDLPFFLYHSIVPHFLLPSCFVTIFPSSYTSTYKTNCCKISVTKRRGYVRSHPGKEKEKISQALNPAARLEKHPDNKRQSGVILIPHLLVIIHATSQACTLSLHHHDPQLIYTQSAPFVHCTHNIPSPLNLPHKVWSLNSTLHIIDVNVFHEEVFSFFTKQIWTKRPQIYTATCRAPHTAADRPLWQLLKWHFIKHICSWCSPSLKALRLFLWTEQQTEDNRLLLSPICQM